MVINLDSNFNTVLSATVEKLTHEIKLINVLNEGHTQRIQN